MRNIRRDQWARLFLVALWVLVAMGLVALASASQPLGMRRHADAAHFFKRQLVWLGVGSVLAWLAARLPISWWRAGAYPMALAALVMLVAVLAFGPKINGAKRWLFSMQPSEPARFAMIVMLARYMADAPLRMRRMREGIVVPAVLVLVPFALMMGEPDVGGAVVLVTVAGVMMFLGGCDVRWLVRLALAVGVAVGLYIASDSHRAERVRMWWEGDSESALAWQTRQANRAFVSGGLWGVGLGHGVVKKHLPEAHTDYVLAVIAEEMGLPGTMGFTALFFVLTLSGLAIARGVTNNGFGRLLSYGLLTAISCQALLNVAVVCGALPPKGIPLPLVSYGGSNYIVMLVQAGLLLRLAREPEFSAGRIFWVETPARPEPPSRAQLRVRTNPASAPHRPAARSARRP